MENPKTKIPSQSSVTTRYLVMPGQANPYGTAFGGAIVAWIDTVAAMAAQRHASREVVTAGMDSIIFKSPVYVGDQVVLKASVNYAGNTSMEVGVQVSREDPVTGDKTVTTTAHLTFVALDKNKKPVQIPKISPQSDDQKRWYKNAQTRVKARKELRKKIL